MARLTRACLAVLIVLLLAPAPALAERKVVIRGGGWGHGIGMSQYGALGRARNGASATKILTHYYSRTSVTTRPMPDLLRVGLLQYQSIIEVDPQAVNSSGGRVKFVSSNSGNVIASGGPDSYWKVEASPTGGIRLYRNGNRIKKDGHSVFGSPSNPMKLIYAEHGTRVRIVDKGLTYSYGVMLFDPHPTPQCSVGYCLRLVNALPMQKYLYGLGEVPASWPAAALRAQSIAGRTYAFEKVKRLGQHRPICDCAVYDSVIDQAFIGDAKRTGSGSYWDDWKSAVNGTNAMVILHSGAPIQALYSSSSGGHTENNENVWGGGALPYLRGVPDRPDSVSDNPNHNWNVTMSWAAFSSRLNAAYGIGQLKRFRVVPPRGVSGRVTVVKSSTRGGAKVVGTTDTDRVDGWSLRSALSLKDTLFYVDIRIAIGERFQALHRRLDGAPGEPTSDPYDVPRGWAKPLGRAQNFEVGRMTWRKATDRTVWQWGRVLRKYDDEGRERSPYSMPTSSVWGPGAHYGASYVNGTILWSEDTGAHGVLRGFKEAFWRNGGVNGHLGLPIRDKHTHSSVPNGMRQRFKTGSLYRTPGYKVWALWGAIDRRYRKMDAATSACGYPTADQKGTNNTGTATFQNGTMTWTLAGVQVDCS